MKPIKREDNAPERIWIIPYSVDEWYYESDMYTGSIEYILTSVTDERMREFRDKLQEAEFRLKNWLAVRAEELYYTRQDATKHIRAAWHEYQQFINDIPDVIKGQEE